MVENKWAKLQTDKRWRAEKSRKAAVTGLEASGLYLLWIIIIEPITMGRCGWERRERAADGWHRCFILHVLDMYVYILHQCIYHSAHVR